MIILDPEVEETAKPVLDKFLTVVTKDKGTIDNFDLWGKRKMAYRINKKEEGVYAVVNFTATSPTAKELDRQLNLSESVLRTKLLRADAK
jgi:small subunit ribosomal protein S6